MFKWFLKLLGINEDRPTAKSSLLSAAEAQTQVKEKEPAKQQPAAEKKPAPKAEIKAEAPQTSPIESQSINDAYPDLKANIIKILAGAGFSTKAAIDKAADQELLALKGIGQATIKVLRK